MKNKMLPTLLILVLFVACSGGGAGSEKSPLVSLNIAGADGYLRVWNSPAKLNTVKDAEVKEVIWTDEKGAEVKVPVTESKLLSTDYMVLQYSYDDSSVSAVADIATGELVEIPAPGNWSEIKYRNNRMYYVSGGAVLNVDPATGESVKLNDSDTVPAGYMILSETETPFILTGSFKRSYPGGVSRELSGSPAALRLYEGLSGAESGGLKSHSLIYDETADTYYMIHWSGNAYWEQIIADNGSVTEGPSTALSHPFATGARRVGSGTPTADNSVFADYEDVYTMSVSGGTISLTEAYTETNPGLSVTESKYVDGLYYYQSNTIDNMVYQIRESNLVDTDRVLVEVGIYDLDDWDVVAGEFFWIDDTGSWVMDLSTGDVSEYQASAVEAVRE